MVISLTAKGLTTGEVEAHLAEVYATTISRETISKITDRVLGELAGWQTRPLDRVYPVVFIDAIVVKIRDGQVANRPVYTAIGASVDGQRDILGLWVGSGGEGAKHWLAVLTEIKNRGVEDVCIVTTADPGPHNTPDLNAKSRPVHTRSWRSQNRCRSARSGSGGADCEPVDGRCAVLDDPSSSRCLRLVRNAGSGAATGDAGSLAGHCSVRHGEFRADVARNCAERRLSARRSATGGEPAPSFGASRRLRCITCRGRRCSRSLCNSECIVASRIRTRRGSSAN